MKCKGNIINIVNFINNIYMYYLFNFISIKMYYWIIYVLK